jgi:hypothetical protein
MANPNIVGVTTISGKTAVQAVGLTATDIVANAAASGKILKINSLTVSNIDGTNAADVTVDFFRSSVAYNIAKTVTVPADATLVVISKDTTIYLEEGDSIRVLASATGDLEAICSYEEIS